MSGDSSSVDGELAAFEAGALDPAAFSHTEHLRLSWEMLLRRSFPETVARITAALRKLTAKAGKPEKYNETVTVAFLALIAERQARDPCANWDEFIKRNADLRDKRVLERWYEPADLQGEVARRTFILPKPDHGSPGIPPSG